MEEDIKIIEEMLILNKNRIEPQIEQAIKNLINKNKELRQEVAEYERRETQQNKNMVSVLEESLKYCLEIKDLEEKNKEQQKIIEFMASFIEVADLDEDIAKTYCLNEACAEIDGCKKCIKEYFKKKASEENE